MLPKHRFLWRLYSAQLLLTVLALGALSWFAWHTLEKMTMNSLRNKLAFVLQGLESQVAEQLSPTADSLPEEPFKLQFPPAIRVTIIQPDGLVYYDSHDSPNLMGNHLRRSEIQQALAGETGYAVRTSASTGQRMIYLAQPIMHHGKQLGVLRSSLAESETHNKLRELQQQIAAVTLLVLLGSAIAAYLYCVRLARPLEQMSATASKLAEGNYARLVQLPDSLELQSLGSSINQMARQLEERSMTIDRQGDEQEAILASMGEGVIALDLNQRIISINKAAAELFGHSPAELYGRILYEVVRNVELRSLASSAIQSSDPLEQSLTFHGETDHILRVRGTRLHSSDGGSIGVVLVLNDITRYRNLENMRRDFVANVSHELKTPIASIKGFVETLLDAESTSPEDSRRFLKIVARQADRLSSIIDDLLALSKIEQSREGQQLQVEPERLQAILDIAVNECQDYALERGVLLVLECDPEIVVAVNRRLLEQAVTNLLNNAINSSEAAETVLVQATVNSTQIEIAVIDHGIGIAQEHLPRVFERFYRVDRARSRKLGGTGLGLAIVKHIAQAHRGNITVTSKLGAGSTFTLTLPNSQ